MYAARTTTTMFIDQHRSLAPAATIAMLGRPEPHLIFATFAIHGNPNRWIRIKVVSHSPAVRNSYTPSFSFRIPHPHNQL